MVKKVGGSSRPLAIFYTIGAMYTAEEFAAMEALEKDFEVKVRNGATREGNPEPANLHAGNVPSYFKGMKLPTPDDEKGEAKVEYHDFLKAKKDRQKKEVAAKKGGGAAAPAKPAA